MSSIQLPETVLSRDGDHRGQPTGSTYRCQMAGCTGLRMPVRWDDGKTTRPCTKGFDIIDAKTWKIA